MKPRCLMVVHAHPDDEVFSTGGIIAKYAAAGDRVVVVYCTNGEAGEMYHPELDPEEALARLGELRQEEARAACALLGATDVCFLGYRDSGMKDTEPNKQPDAFMNQPFEETVDRLVGVMRDTQPDVVVTYDESGGYGHPDHVMTNRITVAAFEKAHQEPWGPAKLYYSARSRESFRRYAEGLAALDLKIPWVNEDFNFDEYGVPDMDITAHIDIARYTSLKQKALAIHRTQIKPDNFYLSIPGERLSEFSGIEHFQRVVPPSRPGDQEHDLFAEVGESGEAVA